MFETRISTTNQQSLQKVISRLTQEAVISGIILVGSAGQDQLTPTSDYDLVLILSTMPVPLHTGVTYIDGRFTDLLFHTTEQIDQILVATAPFAFWDWNGRLVGWLANGKIVFDRHGTVGRAQAKVKAGGWIKPLGDQAAYAAWQRINYNLAVARRYCASNDPTYLRAATLRMMIYGPQDLFWSYFEVRYLAPESEKQQLHYLQQHDPTFLALFEQFLGEGNLQEKFRLYEELATWVLKPVGKLWQAGETILNLSTEELTPELEKTALSFWSRLTI